MAKKNDHGQSPARKKQRWYHNFIDAYKVVKRTYPWIGIAMIAAPVVLIALGVLGAIFLRLDHYCRDSVGFGRHEPAGLPGASRHVPAG